MGKELITEVFEVSENLQFFASSKGTRLHIPAFFSKGGNFCDSLFAFLD